MKVQGYKFNDYAQTEIASMEGTRKELRAIRDQIDILLKDENEKRRCTRAIEFGDKGFLISKSAEE